MPFIVANYVYTSSQGQRTHSARSNICLFHHIVFIAFTTNESNQKNLINRFNQINQILFLRSTDLPIIDYALYSVDSNFLSCLIKLSYK